MECALLFFLLLAFKYDAEKDAKEKKERKEKQLKRIEDARKKAAEPKGRHISGLYPNIVTLDV